MRYWHSYRFVFDNPNWLKNLALGCVCSLIPWIGQIVLIGYFFEVIDFLLRRRQREQLQLARGPADPMGEWVMDALPVDEDHEPATYPDFDFNRFSEYLTRGIWPFLVRMIVNMIVGMLVGFVGVVGFMIVGFAAAAADSPLLMLAGYGLFWLAYTFLMVVAGILTLPLYLRAGLSCDFSTAFSMEFYRDFLRRVGN